MKNILLFNTCDSSHGQAFWREAEELLLADHTNIYEISSSEPVWLTQGMDVRILSVAGDEWSLDAVSLETVLERAGLWGHAFSKRHYQQCLSGFTAMLLAIRPDLILLWNGESPTFMLLRGLLQNVNVPVLYCERSPWPEWISCDPDGILCNARYATQPHHHEAKSESTALYNNYEAYIKRSSKTWWAQNETNPNRRGEISKKAKGKKIILFCAQVDQDTQNFLFSPLFDGTKDALSWLIDVLKDREDIFILGKHHPKDLAAPDEYREILHKADGLWIEDLPLHECFDLTEHVVAVNSSVLCEAALNGKAVLAMGQTPITSCPAVRHLESREDADLIFDFIDSKPMTEEAIIQWKVFSNHAFRDFLFFTGENETLQARGASAFVACLNRFLKAEPVDYGPLETYAIESMSMQTFDDHQKLKARQQIPQRLAGINYKKLVRLNIRRLLTWPLRRASRFWGH